MKRSAAFLLLACLCLARGAAGSGPHPDGAAAGAAAAPQVREDPGAAVAGQETGERVRVLNLLRGSSLDPRVPARSDAAMEADLEQIEFARGQRDSGNPSAAVESLVGVLSRPAAEEVHRQALLELGFTVEGEGLLGRAQQIYSQYVSRYPQHPSVLEVSLRQGRIHRRMGASTLAVSKFYVVMSTALRLRLDQLEDYQRLVLQAQTEIADTYYGEGRWDSAREFLKRLLKLESPQLDRAQIQYKLVRVLAMQEDTEQTVAHARRFIEEHAGSPNVAEVRFTLANALKKLGRNEEALREVMLLLESQRTGPMETWAYWQKRAGNEIGNQLYREGDYLGSLTIYQRLAQLDAAAAWQIPVYYQIGLVYERLVQPQSAMRMYEEIQRRHSELSPAAETPELRTVVEMAAWRRSHLEWLQNAERQAADLRQQPASVVPGGHG